MRRIRDRFGQRRERCPRVGGDESPSEKRLHIIQEVIPDFNDKDGPN